MSPDAPAVSGLALTYDRLVLRVANESRFRARKSRAESRGRTPRSPKPHVRLLVFAALAAAVGVTSGIAVAAKQWLGGDPAPAPVVSDFKTYKTQLGFHPDSDKAVAAAQDGAFKLYATTNREGTYCVVVDEPWKHADAGDGGVCVPRHDAVFPITAGVVGASSGVSVVAGRVAVDGARTVRFSSPTGDEIERPLGPSSFYVAGVQTANRCPATNWKPTFSAFDAEGRELLSSQILLEQVDRYGCGGAATAPHGPYGRG